MSDVFTALDHDRIRKILLEEWDPAGIRHEPGAQDEYDDYAKTAYRMLTKRDASAQKMFAFLQWVESDQMGLGPSSEALSRRWQAVDALMALTRVLN
jgi:hypothetical protein